MAYGFSWYRIPQRHKRQTLKCGSEIDGPLIVVFVGNGTCHSRLGGTLRRGPMYLDMHHEFYWFTGINHTYIYICIVNWDTRAVVGCPIEEQMGAVVVSDSECVLVVCWGWRSFIHFRESSQRDTAL